MCLRSGTYWPAPVFQPVHRPGDSSGSGLGAETRPAGAEDDQRGAETRPVSPLDDADGGGNAPSAIAASNADAGGGGNAPIGVDALREAFANETVATLLRGTMSIVDME